MKKIEKTIKKRCKAVLTLILSVVIVMGVVAWPNGVYAKTYGYDGFQTYFNDYAGTILFPGDTVTRDERGDGYLHVRYLIYDRSYNWLELQTTADFLPFYEAWGNADYVIDTDDYMLYKSNFTFPQKPDTGNDDFYIYEVYQSMRTSASRTLANGELADNCAIVEILARPAHKVTFHDKNGDVIDTGANRYFYEMPSGEADVYLMSVSDNEDEPILDSDEKLGEFLGWSNNEEFISTDDNPESAFIYKDRGFDYGSDVLRNEIPGLLNFYPVYEYIDTTLEVSAKDFEEGNSIKDNLSVETDRPSDKRDYSISYEKINDDGTIEALNGEPSEVGNYQVIVKLDKSGETVVNNDGIVISRGYSSAKADAKFSITAKEEEKKETEEPKKEETQTEDKKEEKLKGSVSISMNSFHYGGKAPSPVISSTTNDTSKAVVKYKRSDSPDSAFSASVPSDIGTYVASVTLPANDKYEACSRETTFTISYLPTPSDAYTLDAKKGDKGFYLTDVKIIPKKGFEISYGDRRHYSNNAIKLDASTNSISFFLRDETTLEETAVIVIGNIKIDNTAPKILDMQKDGLYYGDDDDFLKAVVSDENIDHVLLGEKSVALKSDDKGNMTFDIPVEKKKTTVTFTVFDEAGNKTEISILVAPGWRKDGRIKKGRLFVPKDEKSIFTEGNNWGTVGKKTVYVGGNDFYPVEEGEYEFEVR